MPDITPETTAPAEEEAPEETSTPDPVAAAVAAERKRQSGIEAARLEAIRERDEWKQRAEAALSGKKPKDDDGFDPEEFKKSVMAEAAKAIEAAQLDAKFPKAREQYPEVTDRAKLAQLETLLGDDGVPETPKPIGNSPAKGASGAKSIDDMSIDELKAHMRTFSREDMGL